MEPNTENKILSVAEFNQLLNEVFAGLPEFVIEGEITSLQMTKGNAVFIDLKDLKQQACVRASNYAPWVSGLKEVEEGMHVLIYGKPEIYSPRGSFSLKVKKIEPVGEGALKIAFEKLKQALEKEGFFAPERKRKIVGPVQKIALITGKDSAAYSDFTKIIEEYHSAIEIDFYPALVQGQNAEREIIAAISRANLTDVDLIVLTRGGGSLEDLRAFNSEELAKQIFTSKLPIISGVGHEIDVSIADMVADVRASTPSQAAYYLVSLNQQFLENIYKKLELFETTILQSIPDVYSIKYQLQQIETKLISQVPSTEKLEGILKVTEMKLQSLVSQVKTKNTQVEHLLTAYNPQAVLDRGYALVSEGEKYISSIKDVAVDDKLKLRLKDGELLTQALKKF